MLVLHIRAVDIPQLRADRGTIIRCHDRVVFGGDVRGNEGSSQVDTRTRELQRSLQTFIYVVRETKYGDWQKRSKGEPPASDDAEARMRIATLDS